MLHLFNSNNSGLPADTSVNNSAYYTMARINSLKIIEISSFNQSMAIYSTAES